MKVLRMWKVLYTWVARSPNMEGQRIQKANGAFVQLYPVWRNNNISIRTKLQKTAK
jgi:hypothetical protein